MSDQPDTSPANVPSQPAEDAELARALEGYLSGLEAGRRPNAQQLVAEHPAIAERLRTCLASLQFLEQAAGVAGSWGDPLTSTSTAHNTGSAPASA